MEIVLKPLSLDEQLQILATKSDAMTPVERLRALLQYQADQWLVENLKLAEQWLAEKGSNNKAQIQGPVVITAEVTGTAYRLYLDRWVKSKCGYDLADRNSLTFTSTPHWGSDLIVARTFQPK